MRRLSDAGPLRTGKKTVNKEDRTTELKKLRRPVFRLYLYQRTAPISFTSSSTASGFVAQLVQKRTALCVSSMRVQ